MRSVLIGGRDVELAGGALTPLAWRRAFGDDGLMDASVRLDRYLLAQAAADDEAMARAQALAEETGEPAPVEGAGYVDGFPTADLMRLAYSLAWTADYSAGRATPPFERWLAGLGQVSVFPLALEVSAELSAGLFRRPQG